MSANEQTLHRLDVLLAEVNKKLARVARLNANISEACLGAKGKFDSNDIDTTESFAAQAEEETHRVMVTIEGIRTEIREKYTK